MFFICLFVNSFFIFFLFFLFFFDIWFKYSTIPTIIFGFKQWCGVLIIVLHCCTIVFYNRLKKYTTHNLIVIVVTLCICVTFHIHIHIYFILHINIVVFNEHFSKWNIFSFITIIKSNCIQFFRLYNNNFTTICSSTFFPCSMYNSTKNNIFYFGSMIGWFECIFGFRYCCCCYYCCCCFCCCGCCNRLKKRIVRCIFFIGGVAMFSWIR